jgi:hypothetical protein
MIVQGEWGEFGRGVITLTLPSRTYFHTCYNRCMSDVGLSKTLLEIEFN